MEGVKIEWSGTEGFRLFGLRGGAGGQTRGGFVFKDDEEVEEEEEEVVAIFSFFSGLGAGRGKECGETARDEARAEDGDKAIREARGETCDSSI